MSEREKEGASSIGYDWHSHIARKMNIERLSIKDLTRIA